MVPQAITTETAKGTTGSNSSAEYHRVTASSTGQYKNTTENGSNEMSTETKSAMVTSIEPSETTFSDITVSNATTTMANSTVTNDTATHTTVANNVIAQTTAVNTIVTSTSIANSTLFNTTATTPPHTTKSVFTPTTLLGNTTFTPDSNNGSTPTIRSTTLVQGNQTGSATTRDSNTTVTPSRRRTTETTISATSTAPVEIYTRSSSQTKWAVSSTAPESTTPAPQRLTSMSLYIGGGAAIMAVVLILIVTSISCGRRRKHSKCRKLGDDEDTTNAYDVELATSLGADNMGTSAMILDTVADDRPEIRNYFQDGLLSEGNDCASNGDAETQNGLAAPSGGIEVDDRLSVGPIMMNDASGSTQDNYGRAYSSHDTFKSW